MEVSTIKKLFNEVLLNMFLVNFLPGLILYFTFISFIPIKLGYGLSSMIVLFSIAWFFGVLLEFLAFKKHFFKRKTEVSFVLMESLGLLFGKVAVSILIAVFLSLLSYFIMEYFRFGDYLNEESVPFFVLKISVSLIFATVLFFLYRFIFQHKDEQLL